MSLHLKRMLFLSLIFISIAASLNCAKEEKDAVFVAEKIGEKGCGVVGKDYPFTRGLENRQGDLRGDNDHGI